MTDFAVESIVRDLAAMTDDHVMDEGFCVFCGLNHDFKRLAAEYRQADHAPECPWRRAREWVDANPPRVTPGFRL